MSAIALETWHLCYLMLLVWRCLHPQLISGKTRIFSSKVGHENGRYEKTQRWLRLPDLWTSSIPPRRTSSRWRQQIEPPLMKKHFVSKWQQHPKRSRIFFWGSCKVEMFGCGDLGDGDWCFFEDGCGCIGCVEKCGRRLQTFAVTVVVFKEMSKARTVMNEIRFV